MELKFKLNIDYKAQQDIELAIDLLISRAKFFGMEEKLANESDLNTLLDFIKSKVCE